MLEARPPGEGGHHLWIPVDGWSHRRYARNHPEVAAEMDRAALHLDGALDRLADLDSEEMLRGVEGAAAAAYFTAFDRMIRPPFVFERRSRHPAHNAINAF